jgi:putative phosphoribosyl transferase
MQSFQCQVTAAAIPVDRIVLRGDLTVPSQAAGLVLFAHDSGSSRNSPRNQRVAEFLNDVGLATLLFDLLSPEEEPNDAYNAGLRFDIDLLARRLRAATRWARQQAETAELLIGYFGANTGAAAALRAAANEGSRISAVVTRGGRTDLAHEVITQVRSPTLLIVGDNDRGVAAVNLETWARLTCGKSIEIIPGAGHLFEEPGALDNVSALAARWFTDHLRKDRAR